jgi:hypothetical protein
VHGVLLPVVRNVCMGCCASGAQSVLHYGQKSEWRAFVHGVLRQWCSQGAWGVVLVVLECMGCCASVVRVLGVLCQWCSQWVHGVLC